MTRFETCWKKRHVNARRRQTPRLRGSEPISCALRRTRSNSKGPLEIPDPTGVVLFAHGSGSSHWSPRNNNVAAMLLKSGIGTFLFDLLTEHEAQYRGNVFDVELLARCRLAAMRLLRNNLQTSIYHSAISVQAPAPYLR
jgi:hypothetical protein